MDNKITNSNIDKICNHLQFLGYTTEIIKAEKEGEKEMGAARHPQKNNLIFFTLTPFIIMFRTNLATERELSPGVDTLMVEANKLLSCTKIYYEVVEGKIMLRLEAFYTGNYDRETFSDFMNTLENDSTSLYRLDNFGKLLLN